MRECGNLDSRNNSEVNLVFIRWFLFSVIYFVSYESEFCLENATMFQIKDMFENGKPDIVLKTSSVLI